jgi:hypothetical protein
MSGPNTNKSKKSKTSFYFLEERYPQNDPNTDLNFENDILYSDILDDDIDKYSTPNVPTVTPDKPTEKKNIKIEKSKSQSNYSIFLYFILAIIALMLLWYFYKTKEPSKKSIIDTYPDTAELTMLSPDIGMGTRFSRT